VQNPKTKKVVAVMNNAMVAEVSLARKDATMGMIISIPETCRMKPMLASRTAIVLDALAISIGSAF
jgi:hypothetical protein